MQYIFRAYINFFRKYFPSPFGIAIIITFIVYIGGVIFHAGHKGINLNVGYEVGLFWYDKMFTPGLLTFTVQMILILVLGHVMALSKIFKIAIFRILRLVHDTPSAVFWVCLTTMFVALFNWGLGLIFGAILTRNIGEYALHKGIRLNYPLVGACAYSGLMVWHGGLSGSAPLTIAGAGHSLESVIGLIPLKETMFSSMNIICAILLLTVIPLVMFLLAKRVSSDMPKSEMFKNTDSTSEPIITPVDKFENTSIVGWLMGLGILTIFIAMLFLDKGKSVLNLNKICLLLLGLCFLLHGNIRNFLSALNQAISGASGILIQFPLYFGIMGIIEHTGMAKAFSSWFVSVSSSSTLPFFTFVSAGILNMFVPSGGGQWQVQGPIIMEITKTFNLSVGKIVMAFSYGDQITNMLQPFWALPLLGITGLKAKQILPYTLVLFLLGAAIFLSVLYFSP